MKDLIDRQATMKEFADFVRESNNSDFAQTPTWNDAVSLIGSMPSAEPDVPDTNVGDMISRQEAIDALSFGKEMLNRVLDDMDVVGTEREKYSWGLGLIESSIKDIEKLPSAQLEDYTELKRELLRMASYIDVLLECSVEQKEKLIGFISRIAVFVPWTERD